MSAWQDLLTGPAARALGWALVHFLWEGAVLALLLAAALWIWRAPRVRYALACSAMVLMVTAFAGTLAWFSPAELPHHARVSGAPAALLLPPPAAGDGPLDMPLDSGPPRWFVPAWMSGVLACYLYSLAGWLAAARLKRRSTVAVPREWQERLTRLADGLGVPRAVRLLESCLSDVPVVIGYFRPVILLPVGLLAGLSPEQVEAVLIHELAHVRRCDYLVNVMQTLIEGLFFYHPAVWWVGRVIRSEREHCCDDVVVARQGDARGYAATLARLEFWRGAVREPALAATGGNLMKRVHRLIDQPARPRAAAPLVCATVLMAAAAAAVFAWEPRPQPEPRPLPQPQPVAQSLPDPQSEPQPQPLQAAPQQAVPVPAQAVPQTDPQSVFTPRQQRAREKSLVQELDTPYRRWLNEDVAYIISDQERATFKTLATDDDREQFIVQFWLRRDPTPGTVENEYKEEHYRRIAYANEHFAAGIPGWKTDRGRVYITYGPPDEIEDHASGGTYITPSGSTITALPFQQWRYRWIAGMGNNVIIEFVDPTKTGEFRMTMDPSEKDALLQAQRNLPITVTVIPAPQTYVGNLQQTYEVQARLITVSVPLLSHGKNNVIGRVVTVTGRPVQQFQQEVDGMSGSYTRQLSLLPGSYRLMVVVKDIATGTQQSGETPLQVQ